MNMQMCHKTSNIEFVPKILLKINEILSKKDLDATAQVDLLLISGQLELMNNNIEAGLDYLDKLEKMIVKETEDNFDKIKIKLIKLFIEQDKEKNALSIIDSLSSDYKKINALFLFVDKTDLKEQANLQKLLEGFTKINK